MHTFRSRLAALALSAVTLTGALGLPAAALSTPAPWAEPEVTAAAQLQLVPYELLDEYDAPTTRAEFCKLVVKLLCEYTNRNEDSLADYLFPNGYDKTPFPDTSDKYVALCAAAGIVGGREEGGFDPEASIQRQEAAKMLSLCASVMNTPEAVSYTYLAADIQAGPAVAVPSSPPPLSSICRRPSPENLTNYLFSQKNPAKRNRVHLSKDPGSSLSA